MVVITITPDYHENMDRETPETQPSPAVHEALKQHAKTLESMNIHGSDNFEYEAVVDGVEIKGNLYYFYGGQGAPQCTVVSRYSYEGQRHEQLISWNQGNRRTDFKPDGYVTERDSSADDKQHIEDLTIDQLAEIRISEDHLPALEGLTTALKEQFDRDVQFKSRLRPDWLIRS